jgi:hypothetical protein
VAAVVASLIFAAAYRLVLAAVIALLLAALVPLGVWTAAELGVLPVKGNEPVAQDPLFAGSSPQANSGAASEFDLWMEELEEKLGTPVFELPDTVFGDPEADPEPAPADDGDTSVWREWWNGAEKAVKQLVGTIWEKSAGSLRPILFAAAAVGGLLGLALGAAAPALSGAVVTAMGGSIIMLSSATTLVTRTLATRVELPQGPWMPTTSTGLLAWWVGLTVIGLGIQWMLQAKRADKPAS